MAPFAAIAVLAEASLALPPGPTSTWAAVISVVLLLAVAAAFLLPWPRLPAWTTVFVPLAYTGSVLALILATGSASGVGVVILVPLIWTALFHQRWESGCVVAAIIVVEVIVSLVPTAAPGAVIARRVILWAALGTVLSVATHGLRDRIHRSRRQTARLEANLRELTVLGDRDRIAADLQDTVIQRVFATGLSLQGAAALTAEPEVRRRVQASVDDLDQVLRTLRDAIFGLERRLQGRGVREEIVHLCAELSPAPEVSFQGPVDGALLPGTSAQLLEIVRGAVDLIGQHSIPVRVGVTAGGSSYVTVVEAAWRSDAATADEPAGDFSTLRDKAARAGIRLDIETVPGGTRFTWHFPLNMSAGLAQPPR